MSPIRTPARSRQGRPAVYGQSNQPQKETHEAERPPRGGLSASPATASLAPFCSGPLVPIRSGVDSWSCSTLFGLIAVTGLRISEAIALDDHDVDLEDGVITVRQGKNGAARYVPLAPTTVARLRAYRTERNRLLGQTPGPFFLMESGARPTDCSVRCNFAAVGQALGLRQPQRFHKHGRGPRIHDLRHTFAVRTIIRWYRTGLDPDREMSKLSTYLGHVKPEFTYWYIEAVPELLQLASQRAERALAVATSEGYGR